MTKSQNVILESERLKLSQFDQEDLDFLVALHADPEVMYYIGPVQSRASVAERLGRIMDAYSATPGLGIWKASILDTHTPIGWACLKDLDGSEHIEIGYRLARQFWNQGYATELARSMLKYGFESLRLENITAVCRPDNLGSKRVLEKAGLHFVKKATYYRTEVLFFDLSREDWIASNNITQD